MRKWLSLLLLGLFLNGCELPNNEQIYTCVQQCKAINAKSLSGRFKNNDYSYNCSCVRVYKISPNGDNIQELEQ